MSARQPVEGEPEYRQVGVGWAFPVRWDDLGELALSAGERRITEAITLILRTSMGSRVMRPDFGAGVDAFVFGSDGSDSRLRLETEVRRALLIGEPRVLVDDVVVQSRDEGVLGVEIVYRIDRHRRPTSLVVDFERETSG
ncbi:MAG: GPW/gp25 family protein [Agromyces sp.]